jgi:hypothetical protein
MRFDMGAVVELNVCIGCGCTDDRACAGGCHWLVEAGANSVCSNCPEFDTREIPCPADVHGIHRPMFRGDGSGYCVACRAELEP